MKQFYLPVKIVSRDGSGSLVKVGTYTTESSSVATVQVPVPGFDASVDALLVFVSGLLLVPETDYAVSGSSIVLATPITTQGTEMVFVVIG